MILIDGTSLEQDPLRVFPPGVSHAARSQAHLRCLTAIKMDLPLGSRLFVDRVIATSVLFRDNCRMERSRAASSRSSCAEDLD